LSGPLRLPQRAFGMFERRCAMSMPAPVAPALSLPDPFVWVAGLVTVVGEARRGIRPWRRIYPLLDLPVVAQVWPVRKIRYPAAWRVAKVIGQRHTATVWEFVVLVREDLRYRAVAVRVEAAAHSPNGHFGPPGRRLTPLSRLHPDYRPEGWIATAFTIC
jgi:Family of unknown function (DUF6459)